MPFAVNNGVRIWYEVEGSGPPLVLVDGVTVGLETWRELGYTEALRADYRLILIDVRGHGQSDKPHEPEQYLPEPMVHDVVAVLDDLKIAKAHYVGASMGAAIGFEIARRVPDRFGSLTLMGYGPYGPPTEAQQQFQAMGQSMFEMGAAMGGSALVAALDRPGGPMSPAMKEQYRVNDWQALLAFLNTFNRWPGFEDDLPKMALPCLILVTESDPYYATAGQCARQMPQATFVGLGGGTHSANDYDAEKVAPHLRAFLAGIAGQ